MSYIDRFVAASYTNPIVVSLEYDDKDIDVLRVKAGADFGFLLLNGYASGIEVVDSNFDDAVLADLEWAFCRLRVCVCRRRNISPVRVADARFSICRRY